MVGQFLGALDDISFERDSTSIIKLHQMNEVRIIPQRREEHDLSCSGDVDEDIPNFERVQFKLNIYIVGVGGPAIMC